MASCSYGDMWINGGWVHNGDSSVTNITNNNFLLSSSQQTELDDVLHKLARTAACCEAIEDRFEAHKGQTQSVAELAQDITSLRASLNTLRIHIDDACLEGYTLPNECTKLLQDVVDELDKHQETIDELHRWVQDGTPKKVEDNVRTCVPMGVSSLRKRLTSVREKVSITIILVIHCTQLKIDAEQSREINELKQRLQDVQLQLEYQALSMVPPSMPLEQRFIEQADYKTDKSFIVHKYLSLLTSRHLSTAPPTPSIQTRQLSSIMPSSFSGKISLVRPKKPPFVPEHLQKCSSCMMQIFIKGIPGYKTVLVRTTCDEDVRTIWDKTHQRFAFLPAFGLSRQGKWLNGKGTIASSGIQSLETLHLEWDSPRTPPGSVLPLAENEASGIHKTGIKDDSHFPSRSIRRPRLETLIEEPSDIRKAGIVLQPVRRTRTKNASKPKLHLEMMATKKRPKGWILSHLMYSLLIATPEPEADQVTSQTRSRAREIVPSALSG